jgi:hypothetical protein
MRSRGVSACRVGGNSARCKRRNVGRRKSIRIPLDALLAPGSFLTHVCDRSECEGKLRVKSNKVK